MIARLRITKEVQIVLKALPECDAICKITPKGYFYVSFRLYEKRMTLPALLDIQPRTATLVVFTAL